MTELVTKSGQVFEFWNSRAEALHDVVDIIEGIEFSMTRYKYLDESLWIEYKDGSHYYLGELGEEGKFKKIGISCIIYENENTTVVWGDYVIYNMDNVSEIYSTEVDDPSKYWNVDPA